MRIKQGWLLVFLLGLTALNLMGQGTLDALRQSAQKGDAAAQLQLGDVFRTGQGLPQDFGEAVKWYRLAAAQGNTAAQINLGTMYHLGLGVGKDDAQAAKWYQAPAKQGALLRSSCLLKSTSRETEYGKTCPKQ
jgi:TPR repeat protein